MAQTPITAGMTGLQARTALNANDAENAAGIAANTAKLDSVVTSTAIGAQLTGGLYNKSNGVLTTAPGASAFSYILPVAITPADKIYYTGTISGSTAGGVIYYDANGVFISSQFTTATTFTNQLLTIPANAASAGFCGVTANGLTVTRLTMPMIAFKADHGYGVGEPVRNLKYVESEVLALLTDPAGNLIYTGDALIDETRYLANTGSYAPTNGTYGLVTKIPVTAGQTYCVQGIGSIAVIRIAGRTATDANTGIITPSVSGADFDGWATVTIPTGLNITNIAFIFVLPASARSLQVKAGSTPSAVSVKTIKPSLLPQSGAGIYYLDPVAGSDANAGTVKSAPIQTIAKFVSLGANNPRNTLFIAAGTILEPLALLGLKGEVTIAANEGEFVQFKGSNIITGFTAVSGSPGVFSVPFAGTIPIHGGWNQNRGVIYEVGRSSGAIPASERHPAQKGLSHRLPFTPLQQSLAANLAAALVDITANSGWYIDGGILYICNVDKTDPNTNGFTYEYQARATLSGTSGLVRLSLRNIHFRYTASCNFQSYITERYACSIIGCSSDGFIDDTPKLRSYFDECAFTGNDGAQGHYVGRLNWTTLNVRASGNWAEYYYPWMHDNGDDGLSYHEAAHLYVLGGLYEYNGDGGIRPSNSCSGEIHNAYARKNGRDTWSGAGVSGSGFDIVNAVQAGDTRSGSNMAFYNCVSEDNMRGFGSVSGAGTMILVNCLAKNNTVGDYIAAAGTIYAKNCKVINSDPAKKKVISGTGVINIDTYGDLV